MRDRRFTIVDFKLLIFEASLGKSHGTVQAHIHNQRSTISNHKSNRKGRLVPNGC